MELEKESLSFHCQYCFAYSMGNKCHYCNEGEYTPKLEDHPRIGPTITIKRRKVIDYEKNTK